MHELLHRIKFKEIRFILLAAVLISILIFAASFYFNPSILFIVSLALLVFGMNFLVYLIKKSGVAFIFYILVGIFTFSINDIGIFGWKKVLVFALSALIFETIFLFLKLHLHNVPLDMIIGSSLSTATISILLGFFLSLVLASSFPIALLNLILLSFAIGLFSSVLTFIIWHNTKNTKVILRLEAYLMRLGK
jgi:hypothetical protein